MLKAIVCYSKKIPVPDSDYSSQGYSLSLETEIAENEPEKIQARLHETFDLVKATVEQELANGNGQASERKPAVQVNKASGRSDGAKASNAQIKFLTDLAGQKRISLSDLNADIRKRFGVEGLYDLTRKQASGLLDVLKLAKAA